MMQVMRNNQKGMSLIEVVIVIAIMAIVLSMTGVSLHLAYSRDVEVCARTIDGEISNLCMQTMSKSGAWEMEIQSDSTGNFIYLKHDSVIEKTVGLQKRVLITYDIGTTLGQTGNLRMAVSKSDGSISKMELTTENGNVITDIPDCLMIHIQSEDGKKRAQIVFVSATGKHYIEYQ